MTPLNAMPDKAHPLYAWKGLGPTGELQQGQLHAASVELARALLRKQGVRVLHLQRLWWHTSPRVRTRDLAPMTRQLAALLKAGVPLLQALGMLTRSLASPALVQVMHLVQHEVASGNALHKALTQHPAVFSSLYISMVQAGESTGILDTMMERLANTLEKNEALRSRVRSALTYPCAVLCVAMAVLAMILVYVVPVFGDVFKAFGADLPWPTQVVVALSDGLSHHGPVLLMVLGVLGAWWWLSPSPTRASLQAWLSRWWLHWPVLGGLLSHSVVARWAQTLSALLSAGVPLTEALGPVAQACDQVVFERITLQLQRQVGQGSSLSEAMAQSGRFPTLLIQLCATGEETGALDDLLARAGALMENELDDRIQALSNLLEPLIIVVLGGLIGGILVAMYLPIFRLGQVF